MQKINYTIGDVDPDDVVTLVTVEDHKTITKKITRMRMRMRMRMRKARMLGLDRDPLSLGGYFRKQRTRRLTKV